MTVIVNTDGRRSGKMSKNIENAILLDTYGSMLTEKQYDTLSLYYDEDLRLPRIWVSQDRAFTSAYAQRRNISLSLRKHSDLHKSTAMSAIYAIS